jgi:hypothetical protein
VRLGCVRDANGGDRLFLARLGADCPPDDHAEVHERDLEHEKHEDELPHDHRHRVYAIPCEA